ncbi:Transposable element Tcb2 transposase, partial [Stegodyphus mimosarum]
METATCLNISRQTVSKLWKQFQNDGSVVRRPGQGRKRMTTASEDRYLALTARRNRKATARQLSSELAAATGTVASRQTIYRRLNEKGLYARKPRVCVLLSSQKKRDRFNWCKEHQNWTEHQWSHVLFTDESRFSLTGDSKRVYIWRESGTRNDPSNIVERDRFGSGGVMVWGGIMIDGRTPLHVFSSGSVTGQIYRDEVLDPYVRLFRGAYGPDFLFMDDNARPHRANLVDEFLESEDIKRIPWPPNSPDLNPIENLWDYLGRAIARIHPPPRDVNALKTALLEEWRLIPQTVVNNVISGLKTRCDMCVQKLGVQMNSKIFSGSNNSDGLIINLYVDFNRSVFLVPSKKQDMTFGGIYFKLPNSAKMGYYINRGFQFANSKLWL